GLLDALSGILGL
uniref:Frenatin-1 n=1 Tax=Nyctimystes infrafrenatus TaxID=61195 RepID=FRE1_NYCIN|nr:RecName: Full=Frenatin-1 [Nyctimystes infrafrenatus]prf//2208400A frenatin:ISOTYPE=1 [Nyctimystes infrafrenatus]